MATEFPLVVVYRLNCPPPEDLIELIGQVTRKATIVHGAINVKSSQLVTEYTKFGTAGTLQTREHNLPKATYLVIEIRFPMGTWVDRINASIEAAGIAAIIEATEPHLLFKKVLEEVADLPGISIGSSEGPLTLTARLPTPVEQFSDSLVEAIRFLDSMNEEEAQRFRLCSRWFWRGHETLNEIDRFLSWYIALEVFPGMGTSDVPGKLRDFLHATFFPTIDSGMVKEKLNIGKIAGLRANIVHDGIAHLETGKVSDTSELLTKLEAILRVVIRHLSGRKYDGSLDKWVVPDS